MADYKVTDTELTSIANAIRTKGGTQAQLEFPTGFVSAVQAIPTGGGGEPYIENSYSYVDTEKYGNEIYGVKFEFAPIYLRNGYGWYLGALNNDCVIGSMNDYDISKGFIRVATVDFGVVSFLARQKNTLLIKDGEIKINGVKIAGSYTGAICTQHYTLRVFGGSNAFSHCRVYGLELYDINGNTIAKYIPALDSADYYAPCLHDEISGTNLYNYQGKGLLCYGQE